MVDFCAQCRIVVLLQVRKILCVYFPFYDFCLNCVVSSFG